MKITKSYLKQIIKEELEKTLNENDPSYESSLVSGEEIINAFENAIKKGWGNGAKELEKIQQRSSFIRGVKYRLQSDINGEQIVAYIDNPGNREELQKPGGKPQWAFTIPFDVANTLQQYGQPLKVVGE